MAVLLRSKCSMVWGRGKDAENVYIKIVILYITAHFMYDVKTWPAETEVTLLLTQYEKR